jgi:hypothetical protein
MSKRNANVDGGWLDDDKVVTTFRTLKQGMQESADDECKRIVAMLQRMRWTSEDACERRVLREIIGLLDPDEE